MYPFNLVRRATELAGLPRRFSPAQAPSKPQQSRSAGHLTMAGCPMTCWDQKSTSLATETDLDSHFRTSLGIIRGHHRIIGGQTVNAGDDPKIVAGVGLSW